MSTACPMQQDIRRGIMHRDLKCVASISRWHWCGTVLVQRQLVSLSNLNVSCVLQTPWKRKGFAYRLIDSSSDCEDMANWTPFTFGATWLCSAQLPYRQRLSMKRPGLAANNQFCDSKMSAMSGKCQAIECPRMQTNRTQQAISSLAYFYLFLE